MRWKFLNPADTNDAKFQFEMTNQIKAWWLQFQSKRNDIEAYLKNQKDWDIESWMDSSLGQIMPGLMWEFGGDGHGSFILVLTPEAERHLRPLVQTVIAMAPKLDNWEFGEYRQPQTVSDTFTMIAEQADIDASQMLATVSVGEGNQISLTYASPELDDENEQEVIHAAFLATESLLGEEILDRWVGTIEVTEATDAEFQNKAGKPVSLIDLPNEVHSTLTNIASTMPAGPLYKSKDSLPPKTFELDPQKAEDYPHRLDMVLASTNLPEMWKSAHSGIAFDSARFSRAGERFCYLKMDGKDSYANSAQSRDRLAKTLDERLGAAGLGCTIGGAGGLRYSYIDLALTNVEKSVPILKEALAYEHMPERSWLLFFDADYALEWVGMFDNTPTPLMPELVPVA